MSMGLSLALALASHGPVALAYAPAAILSNVVHAYRADLGISPADILAGKVSQWIDLIGIAHLLQATGANQPSFNATDAVYNNKPTVQSTATTMFLAAAGVGTSQIFTVWLVGEIGTVGGTMVALVPSASSSPIIFRSGANVTLSAGSNLGSGVAAGAKHATLATFNGASSFVGVDNWLTGGVTGAGGANNGTTLGAFAYSNGLFGSIGKIAELIIQAGTPTAGEKTAMAAYFLSQYGIPVT